MRDFIFRFWKNWGLERSVTEEMHTSKNLHLPAFYDLSQYELVIWGLGNKEL
jgi:hypothetical protein